MADLCHHPGGSFLIPKPRTGAFCPWIPLCPRGLRLAPFLFLAVPDDVDVTILGCQVQRAGAVGVSGVPWSGLQQGRTHVAT